MPSNFILLLVASSLFQLSSCWQPHYAAFLAAPAGNSRSTAAARLPAVALRSAVEGSEPERPLKDKASSIDVEDPKLTDKGLPELKGDFDWDEKFGGDDDWITENVPGKFVLDEITLAKQVTSLDELETKWRKERQLQEYENSKKVGFVAGAEMLNGRFAMFFLVTGLLTELWTGFSMPQQVEEMLRIGGFIGFDG